MNFLFVFLGGGIGSALRYGLGLSVKAFFPSLKFPLHTFVANLLACLIFAMFILFTRDKISERSTLFIITGICGGLSTFSTFSYETFQLFQQGEHFWAITNILVSVIFCLLVFFIINR